MSRRSGRSKAYSDREDEDINNYEAEPEDELEENEEQDVTRCICGQDELNNNTVNVNLSNLLLNEYQIKVDQGLFIQCDKCSVWQHGYCVGLFINEDVPDKYWCELCKPDLHIFVYENNETVRTLYKPVNDKRKKLQLENVENKEIQGSSRLRSSKRSTPLTSAHSNSNIVNENTSRNSNKPHRKERRHYDDSYDEQLQKALRESAKESGLSLNEEIKRENEKNKALNENYYTADSSSKSRTKRKSNNEELDIANTKKVKTEHEKSDSDINDVDESNVDEENDSALTSSKLNTKSRAKLRGKVTKNKATSKKSTTPKPDSKSDIGSNSSSSLNNNTPLTKDELINKSSRPRYVNDKSTIYELRKRTGAILEWLGRSQLELHEEKMGKIELFDYKEKPDNENDEKKLKEENFKIVNNFNDNLSLMEKLTESILTWEQKFGKYAP